MTLSPMAWLLERALTIPAKSGTPVTEIQVWAAVEDNQRAVKSERHEAPLHVQQYLAERRTFVDFWGTDELHLFPGPNTTPSPSIPSVSCGTFLKSSTPSVRPVHNPTINGPAPRRPVMPPYSRDRGRGVERADTYRRRTRSRSPPPRREDLYPRREWYGRRSRSPSPRRGPRRDTREEYPSLRYEISPRRESRYRSTSPSKPGSCKSLAERAGAPAARTGSRSAVRRYTFPTSESQPMSPDEDRTLQSTTHRAHIDTRTQKPYPRLTFTDKLALEKLLGINGQSLSEIVKFFPAVIIQLEALSSSSSTNSKTCNSLDLWLEVKTSADPLNQGVKWQIDACRRGLEEYQKLDNGSMPSIKNFYYENRRLFHHGKTQQGLYLQGLERPRGREELEEQLRGSRR